MMRVVFYDEVVLTERSKRQSVARHDCLKLHTDSKKQESEIEGRKSEWV
jgi:ribosomal silencing factor RsfS